jgi:hypothetical protein
VLAGVVPSFGTEAQREKALARLAARQADGAMATPAYTPGTAPGQWQPHPNPMPAHPRIANAHAFSVRLVDGAEQAGDRVKLAQAQAFRANRQREPSLSNILFSVRAEHSGPKGYPYGHGRYLLGLRPTPD